MLLLLRTRLGIRASQVLARYRTIRRRPTRPQLLIGLLTAVVLIWLVIKLILARAPVEKPWPSGFDDVGDSAKLNVVRDMAQFAWRGYVDACGRWGGNELAPLTNSCSSASDVLVGPRMLLTAVDALDTLALMELQDEFDEASGLVSRLFRPRLTSAGKQVSVVESTIRLLGGFLGAYSLTEERKFVDLAVEVANSLASAFDDPTRMVRPRVKLFAEANNNVEQTPESTLSLAEAGSLYLEFSYLSHISKDERYAQWAQRSQDYLMRQVRSECGLYPSTFGPRGEVRHRKQFSAGAGSGSFYEYLLKRCLYDKEAEPECKEEYTRSLDGIMKHLRIHSTCGQTCAVARPEPCLNVSDSVCTMEHPTCSLASVYALAYMHNRERSDWLLFAINITHTCYLSYERSPTGLSPHIFTFRDNGTLKLTPKMDFYLLRPETVESIYYMYTATGHPKYRDWAWNIVRAINSTARTERGFSGVTNMMGDATLYNQQQSYFLAKTLKYLYLVFAPHESLKFNDWMFTTGGHLLPTRFHPMRN